MAKQVSVQDGGIVFGNWKLLPVDEHKSIAMAYLLLAVYNLVKSFFVWKENE